MESIAKLAHIRKRAKVQAVEHAIIIQGSADYHKKVNTDGLRSNDDADGRIKGLSRNALARLRDYIARTAHISDDYRVFGCCLTIPWGVKGESDINPTQDEASIIWREFTHNLGRLLDWLQCGIIYRVELQVRKTVHWHLMVYLPVLDDSTNAKYLDALGKLQLKHKGLPFLDLLLPKKRTRKPMIDCGAGSPDYFSYALRLLRAHWILANNRAYDIIAKRRGATASAPQAPIKTFGFCFDAIPLDGVKSGVAYLAAHTTKHKQDQLGYDGKQWGVLGSRWLYKPDALTLDADLATPIRVVAFRLLRKWIQRNRTASDHRVCIPRRRFFQGAEVYTGLVVRNTRQIYLFGTPPDVVARAFECASLGLYVHTGTN